MKFISLYIVLLFCVTATAQITVPNSTLPEVGDILEFTRFDYDTETTSFKEQGENLNWSYSGFMVTGPATEDYLDIAGTELGDSFPSANMIVDIAGFQAAAVKSDTTIDVIGLGNLDFMGLEVNGGVNFDDPYTYKKTPINYGDFYEDNFDISLTIDAALIPFLDSIEIPLPGATLDSIRINVLTYKSEQATAWGTLDLLGQSYNVLKVEQVDTSDFVIEAGLNVFGTFVWINASDFLGDVIPVIPNRVTHKFLDESSKTALVQFTDASFIDPQTGEMVVQVTGRLSADILSSDEDIEVNSNLISLFPNPTQDLLKMNLDFPIGSAGNVYIYNLNGQLVYQSKDLAANMDISVKHLIDGQYFLKVHTADKIYVEQFHIIR